MRRKWWESDNIVIGGDMETETWVQNQKWWENGDPQFTENLTPNPTDPLMIHEHYMSLAGEAAKLSKCASRQIGAVIVSADGGRHQTISVGYNGAPAGVDLCQNKDARCPRRKLGFKSGGGLEYCPAQHAERNAITNAARRGVATEGATMYCYCCLPCQQCIGAIINAGIRRVVCFEDTRDYDELSIVLGEHAGILVTRLPKPDSVEGYLPEKAEPNLSSAM